MNVNNFENTKVSIIIPCYNDAQYIEQAVNSALNQTYLNKEIIVVDDGSNAATKAVLQKLQPKITKLITQENKGQSTARNVGIKAAKGEYILVLDSDDYFEPAFCEEAIKVFKLDISVKIVTCQATLLYSNNKKEIYIPKGGNINDFIYGNHALGTSIFKKQDWKDAGGYDESMRNGFEDWEFFISLLKSGGNAFVLDKLYYTYRKRETSTTARANSIRYDLWYYIFNKHSDLYTSDFDNFSSFLLNKIKQVEKTQLKYKQSIDYKIGNTLLKPFRFIKSLLK